jgi:hypothetical protein
MLWQTTSTSKSNQSESDEKEDPIIMLKYSLQNSYKLWAFIKTLS